jgi:hypothetical protein
MTTRAVAPPRRCRQPLLLLLLPLLAATLLLSSAAAAKAPTLSPSTTTRVRGATYANVDAPYERDHALPGLPPLFPRPPSAVGPIVVPCFVSRSHSTPYLEVVRHLAARGYRVVLLTDVRNVKWIRSLYGGDGGGGKSASSPFEVIVAPEAATEPAWERTSRSLETTIEDPHPARVLAHFIAEFVVLQTRDTYPWVRDVMKKLEPSLVVADLMCDWAVDAAEAVGARVVVTTSGIFPGMADAPWSIPLTSDYPAATLEHASFWGRLRTVFYEPLDALVAMLPVSRALNQARVDAGLAALTVPPPERVIGKLHLINSFIGFEIARPLPPYMRLIGPVRSDGNSTLVGEWRAFVDGLGGEDKARIVYAAFGQNSLLLPDRIRGIAEAFKTLLAEGAIDGAVWSLSMTPEEYLEESGVNEPGVLPPQIRLTRFAPQKALLASKATRVFISHGGAESCGEAFYSATPVLFAPQMADQPSNAYRLREQGMALVLRKEELADSGKVAGLLRRLLTEPSFAAAAARMRALALTKARLSPEATADEVEYILHYGDSHLADPSMRMSLMRRRNLDVWGTVGGGVVLVVWLVWLVVGRPVWRTVVGASSSCPGGVCKLPSGVAAAKKAE